MKPLAYWFAPPLAVAVVLATIGGPAILPAQTVLSNESDKELLYTTSGDEHGNVTSEFYVSDGKAYIQGGRIASGTGKHRLKNVNGQGSEVVLMANRLARAAINRLWVLGFRADEMRFHWMLDEARANQMAIMVDSLKVHDNTVTSGGVFRADDPNPKDYRERKVGATRIALKDSRVLLEGVHNQPYAANRNYIGGGFKGPRKMTTQCDKTLVIKEDGTIDSQDITVLLTGPLEGEIETVLQNVTLVNEYQDSLMFLYIRNSSGDSTGMVYFDKGQSVCFDSNGDPVAGNGRFEFDPSDKGQPVSGWLLRTNLPRQGNLLKQTKFELPSPSVLARWVTPLVTTAILGGLGLATAAFVRRRKVRERPTAAQTP